MPTDTEFDRLKAQKDAIVAREREANYLAMHLLMPTNLLEAYIQQHYPNGIDLGDDAVHKIAKAFAAPDVVAAIRLSDLGYLRNAP